MKIIENINTAEKTIIVFHGGSLKERNDVSFFEDLDLLTKELFKIKILQNPIINFDVKLIYGCELTDEVPYEHERFGFKPIYNEEEDLKSGGNLEQHQKAYELESMMFEMLDDGLSSEEIADVYDEDPARIRYCLEGIYDSQCEIYLIAVSANSIELLDDLWIGNEDTLIDILFKKIKGPNELAFINRSFFCPDDWVPSDQDLIDVDTCRNYYNNPRWEDNNSMLFLNLEDASHLKKIQDVIGDDFKLKFTAPTVEEENMLKDLNICMIDEFTWMKNLKLDNINVIENDNTTAKDHYKPPYSLTTIFRYLCILMIGLGIYYAKGGLD